MESVDIWHDTPEFPPFAVSVYAFVHAFVDSACSRNPGQGGWAYQIEGQPVVSGAAPATTSDQIELLAAIKAIEGFARLNIKGVTLRLHSDSEYLAGAISSSFEREKNPSLWSRLSALTKSQGCEWVWLSRGDYRLSMVNTEAKRQACLL